MKVVTKGIMDKFSETTGGSHNTFYNAVNGRMYNLVAPEQEVFPYAIFEISNEVPDTLLKEGEVVETDTVTFYLYSKNKSSVEVYNLYNYLMTLFDEAAITVSGYSSIRLNRESAELYYDAEDGVWWYEVRYRLIIYKAS